MKRGTAKAKVKNTRTARIEPQGSLEIAAAATVVELAANVEKLYKSLKPADPLTLQVINSIATAKDREVTLRATNRGEHGIYIERISLERPKNVRLVIELETSEYRRQTISFESPKPPEFSPLYLSPDSDGVNIIVRLPLETSPGYGTLLFEVSRLEEHEHKFVKVDFRIRGR